MTDYLFARQSFFAGMARVIDITGAFDEYNRSATPAEADSIAIYNDWKAVGLDMTVAIKQVVSEHPELKPVEK